MSREHAAVFFWRSPLCKYGRMAMSASGRVFRLGSTLGSLTSFDGMKFQAVKSLQAVGATLPAAHISEHFQPLVKRLSTVCPFASPSASVRELCDSPPSLPPSLSLPPSIPPCLWCGGQGVAVYAQLRMAL